MASSNVSRMNSNQNDDSQNQTESNSSFKDVHFDVVIFVKAFLKLFMTIFLGYVLGWYCFSVWWFSIGSFITIVYWQKSGYLIDQSERQAPKIDDSQSRDKDQEDKEQSESVHIPSWIKYPDMERVEWCNKIMRKLWPHVTSYASQFLQDNFEAVLKSNGYTIEKVDFGEKPLRIESVKCYEEAHIEEQDKIKLDIKLIFRSNSQFGIKYRGLSACTKDLQLEGVLRVEFDRLLDKPPFASSLAICLMENPRIHYHFTKSASIFNIFDRIKLKTVRNRIKHSFVKKIVYPNMYKFQLASRNSRQDGTETMNPISSLLNGLVLLRILQEISK